MDQDQIAEAEEWLDRVLDPNENDEKGEKPETEEEKEEDADE